MRDDMTYGEKVHKIGMELCCRQCKTFAYADRYEGEYGEDGYLCMGCIRLLNQAVADACRHKREEA